MAWVDNMDGTWTLSGGITVSDEAQARFEQIRKMINYRFFTTASEMDADEFLEFIPEGKFTDRTDPAIAGRFISLPFSMSRMWVEFKKYFLSRHTRVDLSADNGDTEGLAFSVPSPPAP